MTTSLKAFGSQTVTIANGQTVSDTVDGGWADEFGLVMPAAFTGATISFKVSADGVAFQDLYDSANAKVQVTVAASRNYDLPNTLRAWQYFQIVSASAEASTRTLVVVKKGG